MTNVCRRQGACALRAAAPGGQPPPNLSLHGERRPVTLAETTVERGLWRGSLLSCSFIKALRFGESPRVWLSCGIARIEPPTYASALRRRCCTFLSAAWIGKMADYLCATCEGATRDPPSSGGARKGYVCKSARRQGQPRLYTSLNLHRRYGARCVRSSAGSSPCPRVARVPLNEVVVS